MLPTPGRGLASGDLGDLRRRVVASWEEFLAIAYAVDLRAPSRLPGWTAREVLLHLGTWPDRAALADAVASAKAGVLGELGDPDAANELVLQAHRDATDEEVLAALVRSRDEVTTFLRRDVARSATLPAMSTLGPLPLAGLVHAGCYELAVHALDLAPCGAPTPSEALLDAGLAALIDVTGALAARHAIEVSVAAQTPGGGWRAMVGDGRWETAPTLAGPVEGPAILGSVTDILDASAGRALVPTLLLQRRLVVQDMTQFLKLAPLVDAVPGLPGRAMLRRAASAYAGIAGVLGRLRR